MPENPSNPIRDALVSLGTQAESRGLPYLLIGGNAMIHYGIIRLTRDIDFLIPETAVKQWRAFLSLSSATEEAKLSPDWKTPSADTLCQNQSPLRKATWI